MLHEAVTEKILGAYFNVYNSLGYGFLEKVYENALLMELVEQGFHVAQQERINVFYKGGVVGEYFADLLVNEQVILELKAADCLREEHVAQLVNYLKATHKELGLLLNFGKKPEFRRVIYTKRDGIERR